MDISEKAFSIIELIEAEGYEAFAVGGCVRDALMGKPSNDIDITTSANPYETEDILKRNNIAYYETGIRHGTVTAVLDKEPFEITTYRTDGDYKDNRHPEKVEFVNNLREDLARRDFTINAMAYSRSKGLIDIFGGRDDLERKIIRAVGNPDKRFNEDALRIMRAIRFASVLGFDIEEETKKAIFANKELLVNISAERLFAELSKLLLGKNAFDVLIEYKEVLAVFIPELTPMFDCEQNSKWHIYDVWTHTAKSIVSCPYELKPRLTMLLHDVGKPHTKTTDENGIDHFKGHQAVSGEITERILKRLKVSNEISEYAMTIIPIHDINIESNKRCIKRWLMRLGQDSHGEYYLREFMKIRRADRMAQNPERTASDLVKITELEGMIDKVIEDNEVISVRELAVNGFDLISLGIKGKQIGVMLNRLLEMVIDEEIPNEKNVMLEYVRQGLTDKF